jgi:hypothetical protein
MRSHPLPTSITRRPPSIHQPNRILRNRINRRKRRRLEPQIPLLKPRSAHRMRSRVLSARPCARVIGRLPKFLGCGLVGFLVWDRLRWFRTAGRSEDFLGCRVGDASGEGFEGAAGAAWGADTLEEGGHDVLGDALHSDRCHRRCLHSKSMSNHGGSYWAALILGLMHRPPKIAFRKQIDS